MTRYEVQVSDLAKGHLNAIRAWLRDTEQDAVIDQIEEEFDKLAKQLEDMPTRYPRLRVEGQVFDQRVAAMLWYRLIYRIDEEVTTVTINLVVHERQDLRRILSQLIP